MKPPLNYSLSRAPTRLYSAAELKYTVLIRFDFSMVPLPPKSQPLEVEMYWHLISQSTAWIKS